MTSPGSASDKRSWCTETGRQDEALDQAEDAAAEAATVAAGQPSAVEQELLDKLETWVLEHGLTATPRQGL